MKSTGNVDNKATNTMNGPMTCQNKCDKLATDFEGIKLDQIVNESYIFENSTFIKEIGDVQTKLGKQNEEI